MKKLIKSSIKIIFLLALFPAYALYKIMFFSNDRCFTTISELLSLLPGYLGYFSRQAFYMLSLRCGKELNTGFGTIIQYQSVKMGDDVYIGQNCNIAKCTIGTGAKIGSSVHVINKDTHDFGEKGEILPTEVRRLKRVRIGKDAWIGNNSVIMADIGDNCVIGAGSVVVKPIPSGCVAVGNPAKVVRKRK